MPTPLVTVITPCYNSALTIEQTIESVINQTYTNWEMLIVDDCSTDNTAEIIKKYEAQDTRIRYIRTSYPSGSPSLPRNMALDRAKGVWIALLDSDDIWLPNKLEEQLRFASINHYDFVYSNYEKMSYDGKRHNRLVRTKSHASYKDILKVNSVPCLTALIKKKAIGRIRFKDVPIEDCCFWLDILRRGISAHNTNEIHAIYREQIISRSSNKLSMISARWNLLRYVEKLEMGLSIKYMITFLVYGFFKYIK